MTRHPRDRGTESTDAWLDSVQGLVYQSVVHRTGAVGPASGLARDDKRMANRLHPCSVHSAATKVTIMRLAWPAIAYFPVKK